MPAACLRAGALHPRSDQCALAGRTSWRRNRGRPPDDVLRDRRRTRRSDRAGRHPAAGRDAHFVHLRRHRRPCLGGGRPRTDRLAGGGHRDSGLGTCRILCGAALCGAKLFDRLLLVLATKLGWAALANRESLHDNLVRIYADLPRLAAAVLVHVGVWFVGALEVLVAFRLMGFPIGYGEAVAIESVGQAVRAAGFLIPGALGVQEAGFIAVCAVYGIPAPAALALSLVKRVPDITLGLPFLFVWHAQETRRPARS